MHLTIRALLLGAAGLAPMAPRAEIIDIDWGGQGRFERRVSVAPGKFAEACGRLAQGQVVRWRFAAEGPLDFNIHYHEGKAVHYPERRTAEAAAAGELRAALDQNYCWMWTNKSARPVPLALTLER